MLIGELWSDLWGVESRLQGVFRQRRGHSVDCSTVHVCYLWNRSLEMMAALIVKTRQHVRKHNSISEPRNGQTHFVAGQNLATVQCHCWNVACSETSCLLALVAAVLNTWFFPHFLSLWHNSLFSYPSSAQYPIMIYCDSFDVFRGQGTWESKAKAAS